LYKVSNHQTITFVTKRPIILLGWNWTVQTKAHLFQNIWTRASREYVCSLPTPCRTIWMLNSF
jgi:hypothetical protein